MAYVDMGVGGRTEVRIHGVSGTPPESSLEHPHVRRITGDRYAGTYRRVWESAAHATDTSDEHLEAYWWGGLTSGNWRRAVWLLLLPFMLLNVAYYMTPWTPHDRTPVDPVTKKRRPVPHHRLVRVSEGAQRLLALSLTVTLTLTVVTIAMDLAGWQCSRDSARCQGRWGPALLEQPTLAELGPRLVASAALPLLLIALLWWQGRKTWRLAESVPTAGAQPNPETWASPLEDRAMWNGQVPVARLRALHITAALSIVTIFLTAPFLQHPRRLDLNLFRTGWADDGRATSTIVLLLVLLLLLVCIGLTALLRYERPRPAPGDVTEPMPVIWEQITTGVAVALLLVAAYRAWHLSPVDDLTQTTGDDTSLRGALPWLNSVTILTFVIQLVTLIVIGVCAGLLARILKRDPTRQAGIPAEDAALAGPSPEPPKLAWKGLAPLIFASLAWVMLGGLAAAFIWRSAAAFGNPQGSGQRKGPNDATPLFLGWQFFWAALAALALAGVMVVAAVIVFVRLRAARRQAAEQVQHAYRHALHLAQAPDAGAEERLATEQRADAIVKIWANAQLERTLKKTLTMLMLAIGGIVLLGAVAAVITYRIDREWVLTDRPRQFVTAGGLVLTAAVLGLLWVGRRAYSNEQFRRTVGILWDLGTFWPRATHPLAPPCYTERAIPDLLRRIDYIAPHGQTALSAHSQGTVIAVAAIAQMRTDIARNVALVTYGCPLRRLYAQYFPAYFSVAALLRVGELLDPPGAGPAQPLNRARRGTWPWLNVYRRSDPIGGHVFLDYDATESSGVLVDLWGDPVPSEVDDLSLADRLPRVRAQLARLRADPARPDVPQTFENGDVDWQLIDPRFARMNGDGMWPHADGHSNYPADPAFRYAVALAWERRGQHVPPLSGTDAP